MEDVAKRLGVADKLERAGLDSPHDILMRPAADLTAMLSPDVATHILDAASEEIYPWQTRCTKATGRSPAMISTGCSMIDQILGGGIPRGSITEVVAESACGKTQLGLQICLSAQDPNDHGGGKIAVYLFSEGRIPSVRLDQLATAYGFRFQVLPDTLKKHIHTMQLKDRQTQIQALNYQLPALLARRQKK
ncbi:Rad51-domain-containing protein, partial [Dichotomocladium elegans]